jgi:hypothetical protein
MMSRSACDKLRRTEVAPRARLSIQSFPSVLLMFLVLLLPGYYVQHILTTLVHDTMNDIQTYTDAFVKTRDQSKVLDGTASET